MAAFAAFADTILYQPNPNQNLDRTLPASIGRGNPAAGLDAYMTLPLTAPDVTCNSCHVANPGPGTDGLMSSDSALRPQAVKTPHLRNLYQKQLFSGGTDRTIAGFGMHHDGHVFNFLHLFRARGFTNYTPQQKLDMAAFMLAFDTGTAPAIGRAITFTRNNVDSLPLQADWTTLQQQARVRNIDLVVHGTVAGQVRTLSYRPAFDDYVADSDPSSPLGRGQLIFLIQRGDTLTVMGVPPRQGIALARAVAPDAATSLRHTPHRGH